MTVEKFRCENCDTFIPWGSKEDLTQFMSTKEHPYRILWRVACPKCGCPHRIKMICAAEPA